MWDPFRSPRGKAGYASAVRLHSVPPRPSRSHSGLSRPGPAPGSAAQAVGEWELFRRTISGNCCCFLVHQQLPGPRLQTTHVTWSSLCPFEDKETEAQRSPRPRLSRARACSRAGLPRQSTRPETSLRRVPVPWVMAEPRCNQHQGEIRQGRGRGLATCCLTRCPCCWPGAPSSYETITFEPRRY